MNGIVRPILVLVLLALAPLASQGAVAADGDLPVSGAVPGGQVILTPAQLQALPQHELTEQPMSFPKAGTFRGPYLADVLRLAGAAGNSAKLTAADDYTVTITAEEMASHQPILSLDLDGVTLLGHDFGPYFVMWPFKEKPQIDVEAFQAKAIWQVIKIEAQ